MKYSAVYTTVLVLCVCLPGCFEDDSVWMPDSSGIVYLRDDSSMVFFDVATRNTRVIARLDGTRRGGARDTPAISPTGDRVAMVRYLLKGRTQRAQIFIFDLTGREAHRSQLFQFPDNRVTHDAEIVWFGRAHWSPDGGRILCWLSDDTAVTTNRPGSSSTVASDIVCIYDLKKDSLSAYQDLTEPDLTYALGVLPFSPDNRGFLAMRADTPPETTDSDGLVFVDWSPQQHRFTASPSYLNMFFAIDSESELDQGDGVFENFSSPRWERSRLSFPFQQGRILFDTSRHTLDYQYDKNVAQIRQYARSQRVLVAEMRQGVLIQARTVASNGKERHQIELRIRDVAQGNWRSVSVRTVEEVTGMLLSPDRRFAIVDFQDAGVRGQLVIDTAGRIVGELGYGET